MVKVFESKVSHRGQSRDGRKRGGERKGERGTDGAHALVGKPAGVVRYGFPKAPGSGRGGAMASDGRPLNVR